MNILYLIGGVIAGALIVNFFKARENARKANDTNELMERIARDMTQLILTGQDSGVDRNKVVDINYGRMTRRKRSV